MQVFGYHIKDEREPLIQNVSYSKCDFNLDKLLYNTYKCVEQLNVEFWFNTMFAPFSLHPFALCRHYVSVSYLFQKFKQSNVEIYKRNGSTIKPTRKLATKMPHFLRDLTSNAAVKQFKKRQSGML